MTGSLNIGIITCHNISDNGQKYFNISTVRAARNDAKWLTCPRDHSLISFIEFGERPVSPTTAGSVNFRAGSDLYARSVPREL